MIGQMTQIDLSAAGVLNIDSTGKPSLNKDAFRSMMRNFNVGSFINGPLLTTEDHRALIRDMVDVALEVNATVPILAMDIVHGAANAVLGSTIFPQQINLGATFNTELLEKIGAVTAKDSMASGVQWIFGPVLDLAWDPRFARVSETFGEDPYLTSQLGRAIITGVQQSSFGTGKTVAATAKHFIGYGSSPYGKDRTSSGLSERKIMEYYVPAFQEAVDAGVRSIMEMYNGVDGKPMVASSTYLKLLIRQKMRFEGVLSTDWEEIDNLFIYHKLASSLEDAVHLSMNTTAIDVSLTPTDTAFASILLGLVEQGKVPVERVRESADRIMNLKKILGVLDDPYALLNATSDLDKTVGGKEDLDLALQASRESIVLLKNENNILPLNKSSNHKILVIGETCDSLTQMSGPWTYGWQQAASESDFSYGMTILDGISKYVGEENIEFIQAFDYDGNMVGIESLESITETAKGFDFVVSCIGERSGTEKPNDLQIRLDIPQLQQDVMNAVFASGTPNILLLTGGRARILDGVNQKSIAVLDTMYASPSGGQAVSEILFGDYNPSGRLPYTYQQWASNIPLKYYREVTDTCFFGYSQYSVPCNFEYHFGQGMSYTQFQYSNFYQTASEVDENESFTIGFTITNVGDRHGKESALLFGSQMIRSLIPETKRLKRFAKVDLAPGESQDVKFTLTPRKDLSFIGDKNHRIVETSEWKFAIGYNVDCRNDQVQCMTVDLKVSADYNPLCESACDLITSPRSRASPQCSMDELTPQECFEQCKSQEWDWAMIPYFEGRLIEDKCLLDKFQSTM